MAMESAREFVKNFYEDDELIKKLYEMKENNKEKL